MAKSRFEVGAVATSQGPVRRTSWILLKGLRPTMKYIKNIIPRDPMEPSESCKRTRGQLGFTIFNQFAQGIESRTMAETS